MGNMCDGQDQDYIPDLIPDGNDEAHRNYKDAKYKRDKPKSTYAKAVSKRPKLLPLVQQTLSRIKTEKPLQSPYQPGIELPPFTLNDIAQQQSGISNRSQIGPVSSSSIKNINQGGNYLDIPGQRQHQKSKISSIKAISGKVYYEGQWLMGKPHGMGKLYLPDGSYFEGGFRDGQIDCQDGISIYPDGSYYRGNFKNNLCSGHGVFCYSVNKFNYQGNWENNRPNGLGTQNYRDGSRYDGEFKDGLKHGKGNFYWADGKKYTGEFEEGYMHGHGLLTKGKGIYEGSFNRNQKSGYGKMRTEYGEYKGPFVNGEMQGNGQFVWDDKKVYRGGFRRNKMHGDGMITYPNGQIVKGVWQDGQNKQMQNIARQ